MRAFNYIPARETSPNPILEGASGLLQAYTDMNERMRQAQAQRINTIMKLANELDYVSTISQANKLEQIDIRDNMMNQLVDIIKKGRSKFGGLTDTDVFKAMNIIKDAGLKIGSISQYEKQYWDVVDKYYKEPGKYRSDKFLLFIQLYMTKGGEEAFKVNGLQEKPIYFDQWASDDMKAEEYYSLKGLEKNGNEYIVKGTGLNQDQINKKYLSRLTSDKRKLEGTKEKFVQWGAENPSEYMKIMDMNDGDPTLRIDEFGINENKAVMMYGLREEASRYLPNRTEYKGSSKRNKLSVGNKPKIESMKKQDGTYRWIIGGKGQSYSGPLKLMDNKTVEVSNAKVSDVIYDPINPENSMIGFSTYEEKSVDLLKGKLKKAPKTYYVPYSNMSSFIKNNFNLDELETIEQTKPARKK